MDGCLAITLLRHGITDDNKRRAYIGWTDSPLSQSSIEPLLLIKEKLTEPTLVFSSDLRRCVETANVLFDAPSKKNRNLREIHFGDWEGQTFHELQHDEHYQKWLEQPLLIQPPNGESFHEFITRVDDGWGQVTQQVDKSRSHHTAIVTHGGVIRYLLTKYSPNKRDFWEWRILHGHGYRFTWPSVAHLKEGSRCTSLQAVPLMANAHG